MTVVATVFKLLWEALLIFLDNNNNSTCGKKEDGTPTCICQLGYSGDRCEFAGTLCGVGYCYNNATCVDGKSCDCPLGWQGNANCTLATPEKSSSGSGIKWWGGLLITGAVVAAISVAVAFGLKKYKEKMDGVNRFNELKKSQMRGGAESDDDDAYDSDPYEEGGKRSRTTPQL
uniref:EGF-like domain-containing protein n=1 Tax=Physcomitrium patens TaxID=3218 RepID=A0A7I4CAC6_PHYPA